MSNDDSLDAFLTADMPAEEKKNNKDTSLEDEFAKLLNDFINQDKPAAKPDNKKTEDSLDSFLESSGSGLDSFLTSPVVPSENTPAAQPTEVENLSGLEVQSVFAAPETAPENIQADDTAANRLKQEEQELARAVANFQDGIVAMADKKNLKVPDTDYKEDMLYPNYKPSIGKKIAQYLLACWDIMNKYDPENMKRLSKDAGDEEYLAFAEALNDTDMQLAIISYVEILINLEICEVSYEQKKEILQKNRIKRELYEEYMELQERKALFIKKLKEKDFPVDAERLIGNYFRVAQKDPDGSFNALVKNPAMFSPIEFEKIRPKFFGLIKVTPEDGIKANQKIGHFIKKLKV